MRERKCTHRESSSKTAAAGISPSSQVIQAMLLLIHFPIFLSSSIVIFVAIRSIIRWILARHTLQSIPGPETKFLIGNLNLFAQERRRLPSKSRTEAYFNVFRKLSQEYQREGIYRIYYSDFKIIVLLCNYETADTILSNSQQIDKSIQYHLLSNWLGDSLLTSGGSVWRKKRQILSRVFHNKALKSFIPVIHACAERFCKQIANGRRDVMAMSLESTLNTVMQTTLGVSRVRDDDDEEGDAGTGMDETSDYITALHQYCRYYIDRLSNPLLWIESLYRSTRSGRKMIQCVQRMKMFTKKIIDQRIIRNSSHTTAKVTMSDTSDAPDNPSADTRTSRGGEGGDGSDHASLLDTLLKYFPLHQVACEVDTFIFAGHDTTGLALYYTLLLIGQHEEVQRRLHEEIDAWDRRDSGVSFPRQGSRHDEVIFRTNTFLDAVIRESLRMFPPVSRIARQLNQEVVIRGSVSGLDFVLPEGTTVTIDIFQIHRDPHVFQNPDTFDPDRFYNNESVASSDRKVFMPFSLGPRSCIGSKFALMELKIFLIKVLRKFTIISQTPINQLNLAVEIVLKPKNENIAILFTERVRDK